MATIGTAHVKIKPVIDDDALEAITARITEAVAEGVRRGMRSRTLPLRLVGGEHFPECNDQCDPATGEHYFRGTT